jgi:glyoxylase-like metal-dependent hydrolase (beta-lactamase superfamily II)
MRKSSVLPSALLMVAIIGSIPAVLAQTSGDGPGGETRTFAAIGTISNLQLEEGTPAWILSGGWKLRATLAGEDDSTATFAAATRMVMPDGMAMHRHEFSDFALESWSDNNGTITFNGTATITLRDGPNEGVPISIAVFNSGAIQISIDAAVVDHFGSDPIYGVVHRVFDSQPAEQPVEEPTEEPVQGNSTGISAEVLNYTQNPVQINETKGYSVVELADDIFWVVGSGYQTMFLATGEGVIAIDAPQPIGEKYLQAIQETTDEPITHMIYSHAHPDHVGAAGQIFPANITYIAHNETAAALANATDPNRPLANVTFEDSYALSVGKHTVELYHLGDFHSSGDTIIYLPEQKIAMVVDLLRPGITPFRAFAVTPDIEQYMQMHETLVDDLDFEVLVPGHTQLLATKDHINTNLEFTQSVMANARNALETSEPDPVQSCVDTTISQWEGRLDNLEEYMTEHCTVMIEYLGDA